jgi:adenylosuccinate lyase
MEAVKKGGDRQELHEAIRVHSMEAGKKVKVEGLENDLLERIENDPIFNLTHDDIMLLLNPKDYIGRSSEQVVHFIKKEVEPIRMAHLDVLGKEVSLKV